MLPMLVNHRMNSYKKSIRILMDPQMSWRKGKNFLILMANKSILSQLSQESFHNKEEPLNKKRVRLLSCMKYKMRKKKMKMG